MKFFMLFCMILPSLALTIPAGRELGNGHVERVNTRQVCLRNGVYERATRILRLQ
jgi:hypothetical protein